MRLLASKTLSEIQERAILGRATSSDMYAVFRHIDALENALDFVEDELIDTSTGPWHWRKAFGHPDAT